MEKKSIVKTPGRYLKYLPVVLMVLVFLSMQFLPADLVSQVRESELQADLQVKKTLDRGKVVSMNFTLRNHYSERIMVLRWYTPLEGVAGEIFDIKRNGEEVSYHGMLVKRGDPLPEDYIAIEAGGSVSAEVDLAESYDFSKAGDYDIAFRSPKVSHMIKDKSRMAESMGELKSKPGIVIASKKVKVKISESSEARDEVLMPDMGENVKKTYNNCIPEKEQIVKDADTKAALITALIPTCLKDLTSAEKQQFETWFGSYNLARFNQVVANFTKISNAFLKGDITYNCSGPKCQKSWYAYVYKGGKIEVFLCPQFWNAPDTGTDSKMGVLIHEVSHEVADTDDHVYGMSGCKNLAQTDPAKAVTNADNHEYFSETFKCSGANYLLYSLLLIFLIIFIEGMRRYMKSRTEI